VPTRQAFERLIRATHAHEAGQAIDAAERARQQIRASTALFGYSPSRWYIDFGALSAFLFARDGDEAFANQARDALLYYRDWLEELPSGAAGSRPEYEDGVPPIEPVFQPVVFIPAVAEIRETLAPGELEALVEVVAGGLRPILRFPEWGGHNRAMLRAAGLALAAQAFPDHADAPGWASLADELAEESWGRWSIEDAMMYQSHWLRALILYAGARGKQEEFAGFLQPRAHIQAMVSLLSPLGILPDFGDSHWLMHSQWEWMVNLEWGAGVYRDPAMKWAAERLYRARKDDPVSGYLGMVAMLGWAWSDETVAPRVPQEGDSALDDLVQKKIVWRTGWGDGDTYALLNYRDEGSYGQVSRQYLRSTLAVSAEKMHHGHADEGGFAMLVHDGTLLLHESGYREDPPDGIYRAAAYHNRLIWRDGGPVEANSLPASLLPFLVGDGHYRPVRTERLYHTRLGGTQFSRVRLEDPAAGLAWDRSVLFLPELPCWIVVDSVRALDTRDRTLSALWWTTDLLAQGQGWYDTQLRGVGDWSNPGQAALWVGQLDVPGVSAVRTVEPFRRSFQDELALAATWTGGQTAGETVQFVSVLWPHAVGEAVQDRIAAFDVLESKPAGRGLGVRMRWEGVETLFGLLSDLDCGLVHAGLRPTYTAQDGMAAYGPLSSDAALAVWRRDAEGEWCGFINGTTLSVDGDVRYQGRLHGMFQEDRTDRPGVPRRFRWESG